MLTEKNITIEEKQQYTWMHPDAHSYILYDENDEKVATLIEEKPNFWVWINLECDHGTEGYTSDQLMTARHDALIDVIIFRKINAKGDECHG